jgi:hypothetical protein
MSEKRKTKHAENQRRYDQRRRDGLRPIQLSDPLDIGHGLLISKMHIDLGQVEDLLTTLRLLQPFEADDEQVVMERLRQAFVNKRVTIQVTVSSGRPEQGSTDPLSSDHGRTTA